MADIALTAASVAAMYVNETQVRSKTCAVAVTAGQAVAYDTNGKVILADADSTVLQANQFDGIVLNAKGIGESVRVVEEGWVTGFDLSGMNYKDPVYLSATAGALSTTPPATGSPIVVGRVDWTNDAGGTFSKLLRVNRRQSSGEANVKLARVALTGAGVHAGVNSWQNPEGGTILIQRLMLNVTTASTGAGTLSAGTTATSATTASANLIDTKTVATAGLFDNVTDGGTLGKARQSLAAGKWVTFGEASGDVTGMVSEAIIEYILA